MLERVGEEPMTIRKILATFDFSEAAGRAVAWAHQLARTSGAKLEVVHVHPELYDGRGNPQFGLPWPSAGQEERYLHFLAQELKSALASLIGAEAAEAVQVHIQHGDPVKGVLATVEQCGADMLCLGATGKGAVQRVVLGSVSESLLRRSTIPVLVVH
jgi:nucleotide-binding universal stress UspA family protein